MFSRVQKMVVTEAYNSNVKYTKLNQVVQGCFSHYFKYFETFLHLSEILRQYHHVQNTLICLDWRLSWMAPKWHYRSEGFFNKYCLPHVTLNLFSDTGMLSSTFSCTLEWTAANLSEFAIVHHRSQTSQNQHLTLRDFQSWQDLHCQDHQHSCTQSRGLSLTWITSTHA